MTEAQYSDGQENTSVFLDGSEYSTLTMGGHVKPIQKVLSAHHKKICHEICPILHADFPPCAKPPQCSCALEDYGHDVILSVTAKQAGMPFAKTAKIYNKYPKKSYEKVSI